MNDIRTERADLDAIRAWERTERLAARRERIRIVRDIALATVAAAATVRLLAGT